jgi:diketogulonate reductase-like aldo/keto reductase
MGAFAELRSEGKIRFVGLANVTVEEIEEAQRVVDVVSVQNSPSPMRLEARAALDYCEAYDIAYLAYASLGGPSEAKTLAARLPAFAAAVLRHAVSPQRVVLAWELALSPVLSRSPAPAAQRRRHFGLQRLGQEPFGETPRGSLFVPCRPPDWTAA